MQNDIFKIQQFLTLMKDEFLSKPSVIRPMDGNVFVAWYTDANGNPTTKDKLVYGIEHVYTLDGTLIQEAMLGR